MREAGLLLGARGVVLYQHAPLGRTAVSLPDDAGLWHACWEHRHTLTGFAHAHPGAGAIAAQPSVVDLETFAALEAALGLRLQWWIASADQAWCWLWSHACGRYWGVEAGQSPNWLAELRALSET